jgi:hypothetical protein
MSLDLPPTERPRPRRSKLRLRLLLAVNALAFGLYVFARLDRSVAERFGPVGEAVYNKLNPYEHSRRPISARGRRFKTDVRALGGTAEVSVQNPGFLGVFGRSEWFSARFRTRALDDRALARLAELYGARVVQLNLDNTAVTDAGLQHLKKMTKLEDLRIRRYARRADPRTPPAITGAGLVHLTGLTQLQTLRLSGVPLTADALPLLESIPSLTELQITGCGLSDEETDALKKSRPGLWVAHY